MCPMEKEGLASCEISYYPIGSKNYIEEIEDVVNIIKGYDLEIDVGLISTSIRGNSDLIFRLIEEIFDKMDKKANNFTISLKLSNTCGC